MSQKATTQLDDLIIQEKRNIARAQFSELWDNAAEEGIEAELVAEEILRGTLTEMTRLNGPDKVHKFLAEISFRESCGEFLPGKILQ